MRYTRNRQLNKAYQTNEFTKDENYRFDEHIHSSIDKSFKWHREYNNVSFDVTHYYPHKVAVPLYVDLYKEDSVYY